MSSWHTWNILRNRLESVSPRTADMKLIQFVSGMQTRKHFHAVTSLLYIPFDF